MREPPRFLVVDPLSGVQTFARQLLQAHGFPTDQVLCCGNTEDALAQGLVFKPRLLITDWFARAPLNGVQLYQQLRDSLPGLRVALLSFDTTPDHEAEARSLGAHFLLKKPFLPEQLKAEVARTLEVLHIQPATRTLRPRPLVRPAIPPELIVKPGDRVRYQGAVHVARHVVHRNGGTVVQLQGQTAFVPVDKLLPA